MFINLNGFHHDEYGLLEKSGLFTFINKVEIPGTGGCFKADVDFGDGIVSLGKTFFSSDWSRERVAQAIFEASQNIVKDLTEDGDVNKTFLCKFLDISIKVIISCKNLITSAYPTL